MTLENMKILSSHKFVVWTQAGFKKARKIIAAESEVEIEGHPLVYPCVVTFVYQYRGYDYYIVRWQPLNQAIESAQAYHLQLVNLDLEHQTQLESLKGTK